jgi:Flp pilus assembly protein TadG
MKIRKPIGEKGVAVIEAALTLIMFMTVLLGVMEAGRFISVYQTLTDAAREGARLGVAPDTGTSNRPSVSEIEAEVQRFLDSNAVKGTTIRVDPSFGTDSEFTRIRVSLPYQVLTASWFSDIEVTIAGTALMRNETATN